MADKQKWNERYANKELVWSAGPNQLFADVAGDYAPGRALDLGCGEGRNALHLAECGWEVTGIDYAEQGIEKARQLAAHRGVKVNWIVADAGEVTLEPQSFDLVAVIFLHTSARERDHWLREAANAVAPGGHFVYIGHDPQNIERGVGGPQDPAVLPSAATVSEALPAFEIERAEIFERRVGDDPGHGGSGSGTALDTLVVARRK